MSRRAPGSGSLRIIGGQWRRRVLRFDAALAIRPTPDRVRETLFNWLAPVIDGARCLDQFAGTGALGLEALSRGAEHAQFVDRSPEALAAIRSHAEVLGAEQRIATVCADAAAYLRGGGPRFDLVFVDPPYADRLITGLLPALAERLSPGALVYCEFDRDGEPQPGEDWTWHRRARAGRVSYGLIQRATGDSA